MTTHVQPRSGSLLGSGATAPRPTASSRSTAQRVWRALEALGAERAAGEMRRAAALYGLNRPALAAVLRAAAARRS
ncbi:hypothetical protein [Piscinibacter koreensis]|uniref:Uncharacterized protein n=1 Tax=Piscinibacter koreensis TaxID=2742824 RepID=A0A7Y6TXA6_9BURK|nr:hypothetical protein [Schlegelella koreensis]NUZ06902.1 hypothetical protein [Schlegelella koreensis]